MSLIDFIYNLFC